MGAIRFACDCDSATLHLGHVVGQDFGDGIERQRPVDESLDELQAAHRFLSVGADGPVCPAAPRHWLCLLIRRPGSYGALVMLQRHGGGHVASIGHNIDWGFLERRAGVPAAQPLLQSVAGPSQAPGEHRCFGGSRTFRFLVVRAGIPMASFASYPAAVCLASAQGRGWLPIEVRECGSFAVRSRTLHARGRLRWPRSRRGSWRPLGEHAFACVPEAFGTAVATACVSRG